MVLSDLCGYCEICRENMYKHEPRLGLPCAHAFHEPCITNWMRKKKKSWDNACPMNCYKTSMPLIIEDSGTSQSVVEEMPDTGGASSSGHTAFPPSSPFHGDQWPLRVALTQCAINDRCVLRLRLHPKQTIQITTNTDLGNHCRIQIMHPWAVCMIVH